MPRSIDVAPRTWCRVAGVRMKKRRPPFPVRVGLVAGWVAACASTTAGTDGRAPDSVTQDAGDAVVDGVVDAPPALWPQPDPAAPRLIAPLSCTWHSSRRPTLRWERPAGVERVVVELCADRPCQRVEHTLEVSGDTVRVPEELRPGVHFWRAFALRDGQRGPASFTWEFRAPFRSAPNDLALETYLDVNGDGYGDAILMSGPVTQVYFGGPQGLTPSPTQSFVRTGLVGYFSLGDVNGDGFADAAWYHRNERPAGFDSLRVYLGSTGGLVRSENVLNRTSADDASAVGYVLPLGDVDGDGYADVSSQAGSPSDGIDHGWIHRGSRVGYTPERTTRVRSPDPSEITAYYARPAGDFDGDGVLDLTSQSPRTEANANRNRIWITSSARPDFSGPQVITLRAPPSLRVVAPSLDTNWAHCDLDGDGRNEIPVILQDNVSRRTILGIYRHRTNNGDLLPDVMLDVTSDLNYAMRLTCVPDFDGDGYNDILGVNQNAFSQTYWIVRGGQRSISHIAIPMNDDIGRIGFRFKAGNDCNGDNRSDCVFLSGDRLVFVYAHEPQETSFLTELQLLDDPRRLAGLSPYAFFEYGIF